MDKVHEMMDDVVEAQALSNEISDAISSPLAFGSDLNDEDLERELDMLQQEDFDKDILSIPEPTATLPEVPTKDLPEKVLEKKKATSVHTAMNSAW